jgi:hypothetical protein
MKKNIFSMNAFVYEMYVHIWTWIWTTAERLLGPIIGR